MSHPRALLSALSSPGPLTRFSRSEDGAVTIPTIIFLPTFIMLMVASVDLGMLMLKQTLLDRAVDVATRNIRIGASELPDHTALKQLICDNMAMAPECMQDLTVELFEIDDTTWTSAAGAVQCSDRTAPEPPDVTFEKGDQDQLMLMRTCLKVTPMVATDPLALALVTDAAGQYALINSTVFVNEPQLATEDAAGGAGS